MATFGKSSFDAVIYATFRPTYPRSLYDSIYQYHERKKGARWDRAVDPGCGTGQATDELTPFKHFKMIAAAQETFQKMLVSTGKYEDDNSADLVIAAQAGHWLDWNKMCPKLTRIYSEFRFTRYPSFTKKINAYGQGIDPLNSVGPHWQQPGRSIPQNHLADVPGGNEVVPSAFSDFESLLYRWPLPVSPLSTLRDHAQEDDMLSYLNSWNSLHTFRQHKPMDGENSRGDVTERSWKDLKDGVELENVRAVEGRDEVDIIGNDNG
ncbi:hypothetical protein BDR07DRAFT_1471004 [Suillus spraguei]|nr:hypothetical protein BDR07DRAFT_1471004 [Suillus spraguei]